MSSAIIRCNLLVELANLGDSARNEVVSKVREFLSDEPGDWLPEEFNTPAELLERSIRVANVTGKRVLLNAVGNIIDGIFSELKVRRLSIVESRQFLGAIGIGVRQVMPPSEKLGVTLFLAAHQPNIFWNRVAPVPDIVGTRQEHIKEFIALLWAKLARPVQELTNRIEELTSAEFQSRANILLSLQTRHNIAIALRLLRGEIIRVQIVVNGQAQEFGLLRLTSQDDFIFSTEETNTLIAPVNIAEIPMVELGEIEIHNLSPKNIGNAIETRLQTWFMTFQNAPKTATEIRTCSWKLTKRERSEMLQLA